MTSFGMNFYSGVSAPNQQQLLVFRKTNLDKLHTQLTGTTNRLQQSMFKLQARISELVMPDDAWLWRQLEQEWMSLNQELQELDQQWAQWNHESAQLNHEWQQWEQLQAAWAAQQAAQEAAQQAAQQAALQAEWEVQQSYVTPYQQGRPHRRAGINGFNTRTLGEGNARHDECAISAQEWEEKGQYTYHDNQPRKKKGSSGGGACDFSF